MENTLVLGVGGAGAELARRIQASLNYKCAVINTDESALDNAAFSQRLLIGAKVCKGNPANTPERGRKAAKESINEIEQLLSGISLLVLTAGLGGGTGTGAIPIIATHAKDMGLEVIAVVTLPFEFEGSRRRDAIAGLSDLENAGVTVLFHDHAHDSEREEEGLSTLFSMAATKLSVKLCNHLNAISV